MKCIPAQHMTGMSGSKDAIPDVIKNPVSKQSSSFYHGDNHFIIIDKSYRLKIAEGVIQSRYYSFYHAIVPFTSLIFQKTHFYLIVVLLGIFCCMQCHPSMEKNRLRIACFPIPSNEPWLDIVIVDCMNHLLKKVNSEDCLTYPLDWSYDAIEKDSLSHILYLRHHSQRIGINLLITSHIQLQFKEGCYIHVDFYYPEQNQPIFQFSDSLNNQKPELFFQQFVKRTCDFISIDSDSIVDYPLPRKELWEYYGWGRYHQLTGDYVSAEQMYRSGIAKDSTQNLLLKGLAEVLLIQRSKSDSYTENMDMETEEILYKAVDIDSTDGTLYRLLGNLYIQRKWWNKAEQVLEKAFQYNKDDPYLYFQLSRVHPSRYQEMGFHDKKSLLSEALFLDPAFQLGWIALGEDYVFYNQYDKAEEIYHQLLEIHPKSLEGFLALGKLYMVQNDIMNIIRTYEKVLEIAPDYADAYYNLGIIYYKENQEDEAIRFFQKAIELDHHPDSNFYLGIIYKNRGDVDQAIQFFRERIRLKTGPEDTFAEEARIHLSELLQDD